jgi:hypothetical protein
MVLRETGQDANVNTPLLLCVTDLQLIPHMHHVIHVIKNVSLVYIVKVLRETRQEANVTASLLLCVTDLLLIPHMHHVIYGLPNL